MLRRTLETYARRSLAVLTLLCLATSTASSLRVYPHSLAYFNEGAGGPENGWWHMLGSNLDWGQGLLELDRVLAAHSEWGPIALVYPGSPDTLGLRVVPKRVEAPMSSFAEFSHVAISANILAGEGQMRGWPRRSSAGNAELLTALRHQQPAYVVDYSIVLFEISPLFDQLGRENATDGSLQTVNTIPTKPEFLASLPSLADARDNNPTVSTLLHVLLLHRFRDTGLKTPVSGWEALRILTDERLAIAALGDSPFVRTRNGLRYKIDSSVISEGSVGESHRDQCLATFAVLNLLSNYPIALKSEECSIRDLISESIANFSFDQREIAWTAIAYAHYLPPARQWTDRFGRTTTFSELLRFLIDKGYEGQSCGGLHVLQAIESIVDADYRIGILDRRTRLVGRAFLKNAVRQALRSQSKDGWWDTGWYHKSSDDLSDGSRDSSLESKLIATGHMLEFMHSLRDPPRYAVVRATRWLIAALERMQNTEADLSRISVCPLTHALRGIALSYRNRHLSLELQRVFATQKR